MLLLRQISFHIRMKLHFLSENKTIEEQILFFLEEWNNNLMHFTTMTSGSTGTPKIIEIDKQFARNSALATINYLGLSKGDTALLSLNPQTIGGKMMIVRSIEHELELYIIEPSSNPLKNLDQTFDFLSFAPIQLHTILTGNPEKLKGVKAIIIGGGVIGEESISLLKQYKLTVFQTFGMTETISHIALRKVGFETEDFYQTIDGITVSSKNEQLIIHAPGLGHTDLETNDRVEIINERTFKWLGRTDFVINSGGVKIQIEQLENELQGLIQAPFFIHSIPDERLGEQVVLLVEGTKKDNYLRKSFYLQLSNPYFIPKKIAFIENFTRTLSDKINRKATFTTIDKTLLEEIL